VELVQLVEVAGSAGSLASATSDRIQPQEGTFAVTALHSIIFHFKII
jgi:hypothetical protein